MGLLARALERRFRVSQAPPQWYVQTFGGTSTAGANVTPENSLRVSAVLACVRVLSESVASLPLKVYRRRADGGKEEYSQHPLYQLLHLEPNPEMSSFQFRETAMLSLLLYGNSYSQIQYNKGGRIIGLWPLLPDRMMVERVNTTIVYHYQPRNGGMVTLPAEEVFHVAGLSFDGRIGYSPIYVARNVIGATMAADEYGARFFQNDARPGGVLEHPGTLSDKAYDRIKASWEERHAGSGNAHKVAILEEGMKFEPIGIPPEDAQFLETRKFNVNEIARIYRVPPHMIGSLDRATFSNIEQQSIEFVVHSLRAWLVRWEQALHLQLFTPKERERVFPEFLVDGLLRGDIKSRYEAYAVARQNGWMNANDIRVLENLNPVKGGDVYLVPLNMVPADSLGAAGTVRSAEQRAILDAAPDTPGAEKKRPNARQRQAAANRLKVMNAHAPVFQEAAARILRRERNDVGAMAKKLLAAGSFDQFRLWLEDFYRKHEGFAARQMEPALKALAVLIADTVREEVGDNPDFEAEMKLWATRQAHGFGIREASRSQAWLNEAVQKAITENNDPVQAVQDKLDAWPEGRAAAIAHEETRTGGNRLTWRLLTLAGITRMVSVSNGDSCPYCQHLDGKVVAINEFFLTPGTLQPDGAERPLIVTKHFRHGPYHQGCDCGVAAVL